MQTISMHLSLIHSHEKVQYTIHPKYKRYLYPIHHISMVSCQKGPTRHAYAWQIGPFWQATLDMWMTCYHSNYITASLCSFQTTWESTRNKPQNLLISSNLVVSLKLPIKWLISLRYIFMISNVYRLLYEMYWHARHSQHLRWWYPWYRASIKSMHSFLICSITRLYLTWGLL